MQMFDNEHYLDGVIWKDVASQMYFQVLTHLFTRYVV